MGREFDSALLQFRWIPEGVYCANEATESSRSCLASNPRRTTAAWSTGVNLPERDTVLRKVSLPPGIEEPVRIAAEETGRQVRAAGWQWAWCRDRLLGALAALPGAAASDRHAKESQADRQ